jgi:catechol 2,3-dioxygenase-like lactoylglutathione lyase family enzyme
MSTTRSESPALLHIGTDIDARVEAEFNRWCEGHVLSNLALPGFRRARRFLRKADYPGVGESAQYLTLYDLEAASALTSDAYARHDQSVPEEFLPHLHFERALYREIGVHAGASPSADATAMLHVTVDVADPAWVDRFLEWYSEVHVPAVLEVPGMVAARRYANTDPASGGHTYCTLYEMEDSKVMSRPEMPDAARKGACPTELEPQRVAWNHVYEEIFRSPEAG